MSIVVDQWWFTSSQEDHLNYEVKLMDLDICERVPMGLDDVQLLQKAYAMHPGVMRRVGLWAKQYISRMRSLPEVGIPFRVDVEASKSLTAMRVLKFRSIGSGGGLIFNTALCSALFLLGPDGERIPEGVQLKGRPVGGGEKSLGSVDLSVN